jgi:F-type H+-transporting ATPase subunit a
MPQFDFLIISRLSLMYASFVIFVAFLFLLVTALSVWMELQIRILSKTLLIQEARSFAILVKKHVDTCSAASSLPFFSTDLLEQFIDIACTIYFILSGVFVFALFCAFVAFPAISRFLISFVTSINRDINLGKFGYSGKNLINLSVLLLCIVIANLLGIIPFSFTFTSSVVVPFFFSFIVFFVCLFSLISRNGLGFLAGFLPAGTSLAIAPLIITIEVISNLAKFISLGIRLFANMFAGHLLLKVFYSIGFSVITTLSTFTLVAQAGATFFIIFVTLLEIMIAILQAFVMFLLSVLYIKEAESLAGAH